MVEERLKKLPLDWTGDDRARAIVDTKTTNTCKTCMRRFNENNECLVWRTIVELSQTCYMHTTNNNDI